MKTQRERRDANFDTKFDKPEVSFGRGGSSDDDDEEQSRGESRLERLHPRTSKRRRKNERERKQERVPVAPECLRRSKSSSSYPHTIPDANASRFPSFFGNPRSQMSPTIELAWAPEMTS